MSLDANLFTLNFTPNKDDPNVIDLVDPSDNPHYRKERDASAAEYRINVYEPLSGSLLASATAPSATSKVKSIELHNPSHVVELKYTGTISFKWRFDWEQHEFEWRREECYIIRKPDPAVLVAVTKEPSGRIRTSCVQILDYNLNRFDIDDRKGLEIVMLTALLTFQDTNDAYHTPGDGSSTPTTAPRSGFFGMGRRASDTQTQAVPVTPPALPPKPAPKIGVEKIAEDHAVHAAQGVGEANEVEVGEDGAVEEYAEYAERLLRDEAMLFVTILSASAAQVPRVLQVVEHTKRLRHKAGLDEDQELFQYVIYDQEKKGPRRINLDDPAPSHKSYSPPTSLKVHLSKIDMPELRPRLDTLSSKPSVRPNAKSAIPGPPVHPAHPKDSGNQKDNTKSKDDGKQKDSGKSKDKDKQKMTEKEKKKAEKEAKKAEKQKKAEPGEPPRPTPNILTKPTVLSFSPASPPQAPPISASSFSPAARRSQHARPLSYHAPSPSSLQPPAPSGPSFPMPEQPSFYTGMTFPSDPAKRHTTQPPLRPTIARPQSFYGSNTPGNVSYSGRGSSYLHP